MTSIAPATAYGRRGHGIVRNHHACHGVSIAFGSWLSRTQRTARFGRHPFQDCEGCQCRAGSSPTSAARHLHGLTRTGATPRLIQSIQSIGAVGRDPEVGRIDSTTRPRLQRPLRQRQQEVGLGVGVIEDPASADASARRQHDNPAHDLSLASAGCRPRGARMASVDARACGKLRKTVPDAPRWHSVSRTWN